MIIVGKLKALYSLSQFLLRNRDGGKEYLKDLITNAIIEECKKIDKTKIDFYEFKTMEEANKYIKEEK